jgi:hypothetical protein
LVLDGPSLNLRANIGGLADGSIDRTDALTELRAHFGSLKAPPSALTGKALATWRKRRGFEFERVLLTLAAIEQLDPTPPVRLRGEQIDGMFVVDQRPLLLEARWRDAPSNASDVFGFQGKLRGKLSGTLGVIVSAAGFSTDAPTAIVYGKEIDVMLADLEDVELSLTHTLAKVMRVKLREAARTGKVYYRYQEWLDLR